MNWTKAAPNQNGYFWWRIDETCDADIVNYAVSKSGLLQFHGDNEVFKASDLGGEWWPTQIKQPE